jgi:hypothetical protein
MDSELIAVGMVLLVVAGVMLVALGWSPSPLDVHLAAVRADGQAHLLTSQLVDRLPR